MSAGAAPPLLAVDTLTVRYGVAQAVHGVSFTVERGSVVTILGPNGAGKSTIARSVSGLVKPAGGSVRLDGVEISGWSANRIRSAGVIHLPEGRGVFPNLTVADNLRMAAQTLPGRERKAAIDRGVEIFRALADRRKQIAGTLSGGEQQMLSLARALILNPRLVLADELSLGLAPKLVDLVFESLQRAKAEGVSIVLIEQFVHRALAFSDSCVLLSRGSIAWSGAASEARDEVLRRYLGQGAA